MTFLLDGDRLREARDAKGLTQEDLDCEQTDNISHSLVKRIEQRNTRPRRVEYGLESEFGEFLEAVLSKETAKTFSPGTRPDNTQLLANFLGLTVDDLVTHSLAPGPEGKTRFLPHPRVELSILSCKEPDVAFAAVKQHIRESIEQSEMSPDDIARIVDYWNPDRHAKLIGTLVEISGQLSSLAPFFVGPTYAKRDLHHHFRHLKVKPGVSSDAYNSTLSFTAAQMVWRFGPDWFDWVYLGMYQSIVRNSVPIFVSRQYFEDALAETFNANENNVFDATLVGRALPMKSFAGLLARLDIPFSRIRPHIVGVSDDDTTLGLFVDGKYGTNIVCGSPSAYLDGDIWSYIKTKDTNDAVHHRLFTRYPNLADADDVLEARRRIENDIAKTVDASGESLIERIDYDEVEPFNQLSTTTSLDGLAEKLSDTDE